MRRREPANPRRGTIGSPVAGGEPSSRRSYWPRRSRWLPRACWSGPRRACRPGSTPSSCWPARVIAFRRRRSWPGSTRRRPWSSRKAGRDTADRVPPAITGVKLICFDPNPGNTRGEVEFASQLTKRYHWHSVVLVTTPTQDTRARIMMRRCYGGSIYVVTGSLTRSDWPYQIAYGWGALFKAVVLQRAC